MKLDIFYHLLFKDISAVDALIPFMTPEERLHQQKKLSINKN